MKFILLFLLIFTLGCASPTPQANTYLGTLKSPGGDLYFQFSLFGKPQAPDSGFVVNGADTSRFTSIQVVGDSVKFSFDHFDSHLVANYEDGDFRGRWFKRSAEGFSRLPFEARVGSWSDISFQGASFNGTWTTVFTDEDESFPATGIFVQDGKRIQATFLTETGDYRFLTGFVKDSLLTLSTFDAAHAFLFKAKLQADGRLIGDFWSRDTYHATWVAEKGENELRDPESITKINLENPFIWFDFKTPEGERISHQDLRFKNKPMLVYVFGSWCPNCADEAVMMKEIYAQNYASTDLQIVGLGFEYRGNFESDAELVRRYRARFNIPWPVLVAGNSDKSDASELLPFVEEIISFPTAFFVDRNGKVVSTHTGFRGPGTGAFYHQEKQNFKTHIDAILNS